MIDNVATTIPICDTCYHYVYHSSSIFVSMESYGAESQVETAEETGVRLLRGQAEIKREGLHR